MKAILIPIENIFISFIPLSVVLYAFLSWKLDAKKFLIACVRMLTQLILIGYLLKIIFKYETPFFTLPLVLVMMSISSWIALHSIRDKRKALYGKVWFAMLLGAFPNLLFTCYFLIPSETWYSPSFIIPLAGIVFAQSMNTIGICSERFNSEIETGSYITARKKAFEASLIPLLNTFMAVGLVSLPGMMTGQILAGVSPLIAVRYQILIMTMVMSSGATSSFLYLNFIRREFS